MQYVHLHFSDGCILIVSISISNGLGVGESLELRHKELWNKFWKIGLWGLLITLALIVPILSPFWNHSCSLILSLSIFFVNPILSWFQLSLSFLFSHPCFWSTFNRADPSPEIIHLFQCSREKILECTQFSSRPSLFFCAPILIRSNL